MKTVAPFWLSLLDKCPVPAPLIPGWPSRPTTATRVLAPALTSPLATSRSLPVASPHPQHVRGRQRCDVAHEARHSAHVPQPQGAQPPSISCLTAAMARRRRATPCNRASPSEPRGCRVVVTPTCDVTVCIAILLSIFFFQSVKARNGESRFIQRFLAGREHGGKDHARSMLERSSRRSDLSDGLWE